MQNQNPRLLPGSEAVKNVSLACLGSHPAFVTLGRALNLWALKPSI